MEFKVGDNQIILSDNSKINLPFPVKKVLVINEQLFVLIDDDLGRKYGDHSLDRNVYSFSNKGDMLWQIEPSSHGSKDQPKPYMDIKLEDNIVTAYNWIGVDYEVDNTTGAIKAFGTSRPW